MLKKLKEKDGAISLYVIIMLVFLLPFAIWVGIQVPQSHELNQRVKDAVDSASQSGVTAIASEDIKPDTEVIPLNDAQAKAIAQQIFASKMGLEIKSGKLVPPTGSIVKSAVIDVAVFDNANGVTTDKTKTLYVNTANGKRKVEHSSVIVTATVTYKNVGFFGTDTTVTHVGINQALMNLEK